MKKLLLSILSIFLILSACGPTKDDYDAARAKELFEKSEKSELTDEENEEAGKLLIAYYDLQATEAERIAEEATSWSEVRKMMNDFEEKYGDYYIVLHTFDDFKADESLRKSVYEAHKKNHDRLEAAEKKLNERLGEN